MAEKLSNRSRVLFDKDRGQFFIGNDITFDGEITIQQFVQSTPSDKWEIDLNVEGVLLQAFVFEDNGDGTYSQITPELLEAVTSERLQICFSAPVAGVVNILLSSDAQELFLVTPTPAVTLTPTPTPTSTINPTPTITPTSNVTPSPSPTPTVTASITPSVTATVTPTPTVTGTPGSTVTPTPTASSTVTPTVTPTVTVTPSATPPPNGDGLISLLNPVVDWRYEESVAPMVNSGSAGSSYDLPAAIGSPVYELPGADVAGNLAVGLDGNTSTEGFYVDPVTGFAAFEGMGPGGSVIAVVKFTGTRPDGSATFGQTIFFGQGSGSFYEFSLKIEEPSNGRVEYILRDGVATRQTVRSDLEISDGAYHLIVITQPHDGSGPSLYIDGKPDEFSNVVSGGFEDTWVEDVSPFWISFPTGYRATTDTDGTLGGVGGFTGNLDRLTFTNTVMSPAQIEELFTTMFGDPDYLYVDGKTHVGGGNGVAYKVFADDDGFQSVPEFSPQDPISNFWNDCAWDRTNTYFASSRSSFGQLAYFYKWDETNRTIGNLTDVPGNGQPAWSGGFKLGCAWSPTRDEFVLAGETNPRLELAVRSGDTITVQSNPFSAQPTTNQYFARFHPTGDWLISIGNLVSGEAIHVYQRNSVSDFQKISTPVDTQPNGGNITQCPRHGLAFSPDGNQVAILGFQSVSDDADISVYNFDDSTGLLTTAATGFIDDITPSVGFGSFQSLVFTPNSRFLYWGGGVDSGGQVRGWDRDNSYSQITLGGWTDQPSDLVTQLTVSPDGKYLAVIFSAVAGKLSELYEINPSDGSLTFIREFVANASGATSGGQSGAFMNTGGDFPVPSPTVTPTNTPTPSPSPTVTATPSPTPTVTPSQTPPTVFTMFSKWV